MNSGGKSINGNVLKISGTNLDEVVQIVSGLPVSDHDHGVVGLEFDNVGRMYISTGRYVHYSF